MQWSDLVREEELENPVSYTQAVIADSTIKGFLNYLFIRSDEGTI
jgi:hypothetical protein